MRPTPLGPKSNRIRPTSGSTVVLLEACEQRIQSDGKSLNPLPLPGNSSALVRSRKLVFDSRHTHAGNGWLGTATSSGRDHKRVPIVFVTAHANGREEKRAMEGGAVAVLPKPVSEVVLFNAIQAALGR